MTRRRKQEVIQETEIHNIAMPPMEDCATATGNVHKNLVKLGNVIFQILSGQMDRHTHHNTLHPSLMPAFTPRMYNVTTLCPALLTHPTKGRKLSRLGRLVNTPRWYAC